MKRLDSLFVLFAVLLPLRALPAAAPAPTQPPVIIGATTASGAVGVNFDYQIQATNAPTSYSAGYVPPGLSVNVKTGLLSGQPTDAGVFHVNLYATNAGGTAAAALTLTVGELPPTIYSADADTATVGQAYRYQIVASRGPTSYTAENLPPGLTFDTATGIISGTPFTAGSYTVALGATNASGTGSATLLLTVADPLPTVTITATAPRVLAGSSSSGEFTVIRTGDVSKKLVVRYAILGSARSGTDYQALTGKRKIKPGAASATIEITPTSASANNEAACAVKLRLYPETNYQLGDQIKAKVKIVPE